MPSSKDVKQHPTEQEARALLKRIHTDARKAGLTKKDLADAIQEIRQQNARNTHQNRKAR